MQNIIIGRLPEGSDAQGVVSAQDGSWQLVIDSDGCPHLHVRIQLEEGSTGMLAIDDMLPEGTTVRGIMTSVFGGKLTPEEEAAADREHHAARAATPVPCPR